MKLSIDNDPGFDVVLRTEDDLIAVKIPIRKGGFETDAAALLAAARFRASEEMYRELQKIETLLSDIFERYTLSDLDEERLNDALKLTRAALAMADNTNEAL